MSVLHFLFARLCGFVFSLDAEIIPASNTSATSRRLIMLRHVAMLNPLVWMSEPATQTDEHVRPAGENRALLCHVHLTFGHHSVQDLLQLEHGDLTVLQTDRRLSGTSDRV